MQKSRTTIIIFTATALLALGSVTTWLLTRDTDEVASGNSPIDTTTTIETEKRDTKPPAAADKKVAVAVTVSDWEKMYQEAETDRPPVNLDLTLVNKTDPVAVAETTACAYWAHPKGETKQELANRLQPLISKNLAEQISKQADLNTADTYITTHGLTETIGTNRYLVTCDRQKTVDNEPVNSQPAEATVQVKNNNGTYQITSLTVNNIKLDGKSAVTPPVTAATDSTDTKTTTSKLVCVDEPITPDKLAETHPQGNPCSPVGDDETCVPIGTIILKPEDVKGTYYCTPTYQ